MNWNEKSVVVTGGAGFLGSRIVSILKEKGVKSVISPSSKEYDLRLRENCSNITKNIDIVFHLAAKVGGIGLNNEKPGELFYDNLIMGTNLMEEARCNNVEKFIALGTVCSYPKFTPIPFSETSIWDGYPEETNAPYGLAKKMLLVQSDAYRKQYNFNSIVIFPTNLYGPYDNGIVLSAEKYSKSFPLNLGTGYEISIKELAEKLLKIMNANLEIKWETDKPNGQPRRCISIEKAAEEIGFSPKTNLDEGLKRTAEWYESKLNLVESKY
jgi:GDP-L-fucose synthase